MINYLGPEKVEKQTFQKKAIFPVKKILVNFSRIIECDKPQGKKQKGQQALLTFTVQLVREFLRT